MGSDGEASSFSWVIEMEEKINNFDLIAETATKWRTIVYRVPQVIKDETNSKAYQPQFVSLGPLHHGEAHLRPMEECKHRAVLRMFKREYKPLRQFVTAIQKVADKLEGAYGDSLDNKWRGANRGEFVRVMVTDGCFLLELIRLFDMLDKEQIVELCTEYIANNSIFYCLQLYSKIFGDMIRIENQLPLLVLQTLLSVQRGSTPSAKEVNNLVQQLLPDSFKEDMKKFSGGTAGCCSIGMKGWWRRRNSGDGEKESTTKLGVYKSYCGACTDRKESGEWKPARTPCAVELSEAGIQFKTSNTGNINDIDFKNGVLSMPQFKIYDSTDIHLLNLMAFEWLHYLGAEGTVSSYISFMDKIIESERDVALLRSEGVLVNMTGSDKKVVEMFNTLTRLAQSPGAGTILGDVQGKVNYHCAKRRNKWRASFVRTYLSNPWVFISLVAATILLVATLLQTAYTIVPFYTKG